MHKLCVFAALFACFSSALAAEEVTYACDIKAKKSGWIAEEMVIGVNTETGEAVVADPIIMYAESKPIQTSVSENTAKKQSFNWELALTNRSGQTTKMKYRAAILFPSLKINVYARPAGYRNNFTARGTCRVSDQQLPDLG